MEQPIHLSIISPVYKAEKIIDQLVKQVIEEASKITSSFELILIEDGSPDHSWIKIEEHCKKNQKIKGLKLSRNFGQHYAITAGLDYAQGEWVVVMDCDLQDRPEEIINLYKKAQEGFDIVLAQRIIRSDSRIKRFSSAIFYWIFSYLSGSKQDRTISNFGIYNQKVIKSINAMREPMRAFPPMIQWVGFSKVLLPVEHAERFQGKTTYTWKKLINLGLDISISYSDKPLKMIVKLGFLISLLSFIYSLLLIIRYAMGYITVLGYASIIVSIFFSLGLIMLTLGVIGLYISKIFNGIKDRPIYLIDKKINT